MTETVEHLERAKATREAISDAYGAWYEAVIAASDAGCSLRQIAHATGVTHQAIHKLVRSRPPARGSSGSEPLPVAADDSPHSERRTRRDRLFTALGELMAVKNTWNAAACTPFDGMAPVDADKFVRRLDVVIPFLQARRGEIEPHRARLRVAKGLGNWEFQGGHINNDMHEKAERSVADASQEDS